MTKIFVGNFDALPGTSTFLRPVFINFEGENILNK
jgi:hypothetical protein